MPFPKRYYRLRESKGEKSKSAVVRNSRAGITRYLQLYHHLSRELSEGLFAPDEPLLSEPELVTALQTASLAPELGNLGQFFLRFHGNHPTTLFAVRWMNGRYLRSPDSWRRRKAAVADRAVSRYRSDFLPVFGIGQISFP